MLERIALCLAAALVIAVPALADPGLQVFETDGGIRVLLEGSYAQSTYTVSRSDGATGTFTPITARDVLCTGECFAIDFDVVPGRTYFYRFDVALANGTLASFGPYAVTLADHPVRARVWPNPGAGRTTIELSVPGAAREAPVAAELRLLDVQGRTVRMLWSGTLPRGLSRYDWDGRDAQGRRLGAGIYLLRFTTPFGSSVLRVSRIR